MASADLLANVFNFSFSLVKLGRKKLVCTFVAGDAVLQCKERLCGANWKKDLLSPFHYVIKDGC
jgi:hypothetical protein